MSRRSLLAALGAGLAVTVGGVARGASGGTPSVEIRVIHATHVDGGPSVDPELRDLPQLTKDEPFVRYNAFKLLDQRKVPFDDGKPVVCGLVDGRVLHVTLVDAANAKGDARYHVRAEIAGVGKKEFLKLLEVTAGPNEPFFVGGQSYKGGTLILELVVRA